MNKRKYRGYLFRQVVFRFTLKSADFTDFADFIFLWFSQILRFSKAAVFKIRGFCNHEVQTFDQVRSFKRKTKKSCIYLGCMFTTFFLLSVFLLHIRYGKLYLHKQKICHSISFKTSFQLVQTGSRILHENCRGH